ncbi:LOW QUALITY PROTEIN: hypothetical protein HID58_096144, partial [Brassica napus]
MGIVLEPPCPRSVDGISIDPEPNWNFASLLSEIESVEKKLNVFSKFPQPLTHTALRMGRRGGGGFVMRVSEDEMESDVDEESEEEEEEEHRQLCTKGTRLPVMICTGGDYYQLSLASFDESDDEFDSEPESFLLNGLAESALYEVINDHQTEVKVRQIDTCWVKILGVNAEALDTHLTAIQREHEIKSQIEERKIRSEEAQEEARRRERAHQEEKIRQEKARAEAERKAAKEAAEKEATDRKAANKELNGRAKKVRGRRSSAASNAQAGVGKLFSTEYTVVFYVAMISFCVKCFDIGESQVEEARRVEATKQSLRSRPNEDFSSFEKQITRAIKQIRGTKKSNEIVKIFRDPRCPVSISIATFAKKIVSAKDHFAGSYVIVITH